jgi:D-alanyl-D-alanine carboxypeptidase (penicillin-binding protein 5/6)
MLLPSGNDAAYTLAAAAGHRISHDRISNREAVDVFMRYMNEYATTLGLAGSHFTTPDGLAGENHYTTIEDMILVAKAAMENRIIRRYAALQKDTITFEDGYTTTWVNTNALLHPDSPFYRASVTGLKTGSLDNNYCVIVTVEQNGQRYIVGIFGAEDSNTRFVDAAAIIDALLGAEEVAS